MKDIEEFIKDFVDISKSESENIYRYWPFHMFVEKEDGHIDIICIADVPEGVKSVYKLMAAYLAGKTKRLYCAIDFPPNLDMKKDFVAIFCFQNIDKQERDFTLFGIPYNTETGETYDRVKESECFFHIVMYMYKCMRDYGKELYKNQP